MKLNSNLFIFSVLCCSSLGAKLPSDFKICKRSDLKESSECLKSAVQNALPILRNGLPELKIGVLEPLIVETATIGEGKGAVNVVQKYKNFKTYGFSYSIVDRVDFKSADDKKSFTIDVKAHSSPEYRFESDYNFNGRVLLLPIVGDGQCNITGENKLDIHMNGEFYKKNEQEYLKVIKVNTKFNPEHVTYYFGNLFDGDKVMGDQINTLLNDNWKEVFEDVREGYEAVVATVLLNYINSIFSKFSFDEQFPN